MHNFLPVKNRFYCYAQMIILISTLIVKTLNCGNNHSFLFYLVTGSYEKTKHDERHIKTIKYAT